MMISIYKDSIEDRLSKMGIILPSPTAPLANYVGAILSGSHLYTSGQLPIHDGNLIYTGKLGDSISDEEGIAAARLCAINTLAQAKRTLINLSKIKRILKLTVYLATHPNFKNHALIANGASDFFIEILGENGRHVRSSIGSVTLPIHSPVEVDAVFELHSF